MSEKNVTSTQIPEDASNTPSDYRNEDLSQLANTPAPLPDSFQVYPGDDLSHIPAAPIAPPESFPVYPGNTLPGIPSIPVIPIRPSAPVQPVIPSTPVYPSGAYYGEVRFLNASTSGVSLDAYIDRRNVFSGSSFATVSVYQQISDGFHTITIRQTNGPILYQQTLAFTAGEAVTMVILDLAGSVTLSKVSDMRCKNIPSGYGCFRVANMSYPGSSYDVRTFNNQLVFGATGYKEVSHYKQIAAGRYTFFVTSSQSSLPAFAELPVIVLSSLMGTCPACTVPDPLMSFNLEVSAGRSYTSYIIGNPWSDLYRVFTLEDDM